MRFTDIQAAYFGADTGIASASADSEERFWNDVATLGTPIVNPCETDEDMRDITFLYRVTDPEIRSVRLVANRVTDKHRQALGIMSRVPGTGIWGVTLTLPADLRCSYGFSPSTSDMPEPMGTGRNVGPSVFVDGFNADAPLRRPNVSEPTVGTSVFSGPLAPDHSMWSSAEAAPGFVTTSVREIGGITCPVHVYTPDTKRPEGLLVLFDGDDWFEGLDVARACEAAGLPPIVIIGIGARSRALRVGALGGNREFLKQVTDELLPQIEDDLGQQGYALPDRSQRIVGGQSLGGLSALLMALDSPTAVGAVLAHSSSLWWHPGGEASPADLNRLNTDTWLTCQFSEAKRPEVEFHLAVGSREDLMIDHTRRLAEVLSNKGCETSLSVYQGGHDFACWRGALIDGLRAHFRQKAQSPSGNDGRALKPRQD
ncbi:alpha/beta hydrolase-fold protein [Brevibacterium sp. FME37]|uniref:alpha/beta hydrolase-fold protein n=1 Tax=Brevibacterium sp. FME37 TaxID=2742607 RepID=UPI0018695750|nr:alpha/beta hydrolase-fold protein [Brevibacterium sp. FME37]